jgi:uncharacterized membrane protein AbrB (regulator of aidB expression)
MKRMANYLDDILTLTGCLCILIGLSMWSVPLTWIVGGSMLVGFGFMYARKLANDSQ